MLKLTQSCNGPYQFEAFQIHPMPNSNQYLLESLFEVVFDPLAEVSEGQEVIQGLPWSSKVNNVFDKTSDFSIYPVDERENNPTECIKEYK